MKMRKISLDNIFKIKIKIKIKKRGKIKRK
jgi:hypothetical protein